MPLSKPELRQALKEIRDNISSEAKQSASLSFSSLAKSLAAFQTAQKVGVYLHSEMEAPTTDLIQLCYRSNKCVFAPVITSVSDRTMSFAEHPEGNPLSTNAYGLNEPEYKAGSLISILNLDIVFVPLLGFDRSGNRIGMGAGYYDRALSEQKNGKNELPTLIGLSFSEQECSNVPNDTWDVPLNCIITPQDIILINV